MVSSKKRKTVRRYRYEGVPQIKKTMLIVISVAGIIVVGGIFYAIFFNSENIVKAKISGMATDYYENYFYEKLLDSDKFKQIKNQEEKMEKYHTEGLSPITLGDLLLYDNEKNKEHRKYLTEYCDENQTLIKYYMDPPYERDSYHVEITYSCNF